MSGRSSPQPGEAGDAVRARALARMRLIATGLLVLMAVLFVLASLYQHRWPPLAWLRAFSEAGMVGACADWFAVTALFRRPFGLPIPHTAIIPRNKDRIGAALGGFIADNFLTEAVLQEKLHALEVARFGGAWLAEPANARRLAARIAAVLPEVVGAAPRGVLGDLARSALLAAARATPAAATAGQVLEALWREGFGEAAIDAALARVAGYMSANRDLLRDQFVASAHGWFARWFDGLMAGRVIDGLARLAEDMRAPDHRLRRTLRILVLRWIRRLRTDVELQARVEALKAELLANPTLLAQLALAQDALEDRLVRGVLTDRRGLARRLEGVIAGLGGWLAEDARARERLNAWARELATQVIAPRRHEIGDFVAEVVAGWDAQSVTDKLELQVGKDLQYIRINGTLVGGLVGLLLYLLSRLAGLG